MLLIIEDNPADSRLIQEMLKDSGSEFEVDCVTRLSAAMQKLAVQSVDAVLLDLSLPDSKGIETFIRLHAKFPQVPVVVLTGTSDEELATKAVREGAQDYFVKGSVSGVILSRGLKYAIERKRIQMALQEHERELKEAQRVAHVGSWKLGLDSGAFEWSEEMYRIYGLDPSLPAPSYQEQERMLTPESRARMVAAIEGARLTGSHFELEVEITRPNGALRTLAMNLEAQASAHGATSQIRGTAQDITERKLAQEMIRLHANRHETLIATTSDGYWLFDSEGKLLAVNEAYIRMSGYSKEELLNMNIYHLDVFKKEEGIRTYLQQLKEKGADRSESQHRRKDGQMFDVEISATVWKVKGEFLAFIRDISQRKLAERALEESEQRFRAIYERSPIGIALIDSTSGRFLRVNPKHCELVGRTEKDLLSLDLRSITHPDDRQAYLDHHQELLHGRTRFFEAEQRYLRPDGGSLWVNLIVVPMWAEEEAPTFHLAMVEDITEHKHAEEVLLKRLSRIVLKTSA
jgi:PAS domain S-box-containing protein